MSRSPNVTLIWRADTRYDLVGNPYEAPEPGYLARLLALVRGEERERCAELATQLTKDLSDIEFARLAIEITRAIKGDRKDEN